MKTRLALFPLLAGLALLSPAGPARADDNAAFPLQVSPNGRYLVDQKEVPFFIHGDSPWSLIGQLSKQDAGRYLERVRQQGFNAIIVNLVEYKFSDNAPRNHAGIAPFTTPGDFSTTNEAYFAHADWVLGQAREQGLLVLLFPAWAAAPNANGWNREIVANGADKCRAFGRYAATRYKDFPNIIWGHGGDQNPEPDTDSARNMLAMALGIREVAPEHLQFYHGKRGNTSLDQENFAALTDLDAVYTADEGRGASRVGESHTASLKAYRRVQFKPHFLFEAVYEKSPLEKSKTDDIHTPNRVRLRRQTYWNLLSGSTGHFFGSYPTWALAKGWDGPEGLGSPGYQDMQRLKTLFSAHAWWTLVPDDQHLAVTKGYGTFKEADYVTAARAADGSLLLAYVPSTGVQTRTLTVDLGKFRGPVSARWFNPAKGSYVAVAGAPFANKSSREFTTPGDNGTGANDWVLVLDDAAGATSPDKTELAIEKTADAVVVRSSGKEGREIVRFQMRQPEGTGMSIDSAAYFHPLRTPAGIEITALAPKAHKYYRGVFMAFVVMRGEKDADFWGWGGVVPKKDRTIINKEVSGLTGGVGGKPASFRAKNEWLAEGVTMVKEDLQVEIRARDTANVLDLVYTLTAEADTRLTQFTVGGLGLSVRTDSQIEAQGPDGPVNLPSSTLKLGTDWPAAAWYGYTLTLPDGTKVGAAVIGHPENPETLWHLSLAAKVINPCITAPKEVVMKANVPLRLRYRVVAQDGPLSRDRVNELAQEWAGANSSIAR